MNAHSSNITQSREPNGVAKKNRRALKRNKRNTNNVTGKSLIFVGVNAAGITSKIHSFDKLLVDIQPTVWMMQETKRTINRPKLASNNLSNYQIFELRRHKTKEEGGKGLMGGGLAIGAIHDVKPVLLRQGDDDCECLTIQIQVGTVSIICVAGYGPQSGDSMDRKNKFWSYLEQEVQYATENDIGIVIQIDSNSWAGCALIPNDPNEQNANGKLLEMFLQRNQNITIVNALQICEGLITRKRITEHRNEKAILDLFLVCEKTLPFVSKMHVDEQGAHQLSNFYGIRHKSKVTESDHSKVELHLKLEFPLIKPIRNEFFNFKDQEGQFKFKEFTSQSNQLSACFISDSPFNVQSKRWQHKLNSYIVQS